MERWVLILEIGTTSQYLLSPSFCALIGTLPSLRGSDVENTFPEKIYRAEDLSWDGKILSFKLERHGNTVNGSSRAYLHYWEVDLSKQQAQIKRRTHRQLQPMDARLNCKTLAQEYFDHFASNKSIGSIQHIGETTIKLNMSSIIPSTVAETTLKRRRRFRVAFSELMASLGWKLEMRGTHTYYRKALQA